MQTEEKIANYFANAREFVKRNQPREARAYVLALLDCAMEIYKGSQTILSRVKTKVFIEQWLAVARQLYDVGVTDFVLESFGLDKSEKPAPKASSAPSAKQKPASKAPSAPSGEGKSKPNPAPKAPKAPSETKQKPAAQPSEAEPPKRAGERKQDEIDISGLLDDSRTQGWCADVFDRVKGAVVEIEAISEIDDSTGTGFIISKKGYLVTNDHVVYSDNLDEYFSKITMSIGGQKKRYKVEIVFSDKNLDVALLSFQPEQVGSFDVIKFVPDYSQVKQGADCLVIGNAFGMGLAPFSGVVRFTDQEGDLVYTAPSNPGDSGGPVLNRAGECIGINKSATIAVANRPVNAYTNATPADSIMRLLKKWVGSDIFV